MSFVPRRHKFGAKRTTVDGIEFASKAEAKRYSELRMLEKRGMLSELTLQPRYDFVVNGVKIGFYKADFRYRDDLGALVVEDVKGFRTDVFAIKAKLMKALHGIDVVEISKRSAAK